MLHLIRPDKGDPFMGLLPPNIAQTVTVPYIKALLRQHDVVIPMQPVLNCAAPHDRTQLSKEI